ALPAEGSWVAGGRQRGWTRGAADLRAGGGRGPVPGGALVAAFAARKGRAAPRANRPGAGAGGAVVWPAHEGLVRTKAEKIPGFDRSGRRHRRLVTSDRSDSVMRAWPREDAFEEELARQLARGEACVLS